MAHTRTVDVLVVGAGDVTDLADDVLRALEAR